LQPVEPLLAWRASKLRNGIQRRFPPRAARVELTDDASFHGANPTFKCNGLLAADLGPIVDSLSPPLPSFHLTPPMAAMS